MRWLPWGKKYTTVNCPGGPRRVYDNVDEAFPMYFGTAVVDGKANVRVLDQVNAEASANIQNKIDHILIKVDEKNGSMQAHFRAAYIVYAAAPCEKLEYLESAITAIREDERTLRAVELASGHLVNLMKAAPNGLSAAVVSGQLDSILLKVGQEKAADAISKEMAEVGEISADWRATE